MEFDLRSLRTFVELADDLSFTRTAIRLQVTQPQLSLRIRNLEHRLGFRLFDRSSRHVQLSVRGALLLEQARRIMREVDILRQIAEDARLDFRTRLRIAAAEYYPPLRRKLLQSFMVQYPAIMVEIDTIGRSPDALAALADGNYDAAFLLKANDLPLDIGFEALTLSRPVTGIILRKDAPQLRDGRIDMDRLGEIILAIFRRDIAPQLYDDLIAFFGHRVARIVRLPEPTLDGVADFARQTGAAVACVKWWDDAADAPVGVDHFAVPPLRSSMACLLVRPKASPSPASDLLWRMAERETHE
ncbi:MAG: LysR family transcriptional regulator [Sphingobium sp.]